MHMQRLVLAEGFSIAVPRSVHELAFSNSQAELSYFFLPFLG
jgi:hypothetical protein